jgi:TonB family protein
MLAMQKIRTGLVELRTHIGSVYVRPSFWERIYLLWTFRNFHSLPKQVLNHRQQQLIDKLCRAEIVSHPATIGKTSIIGVIENVYLKGNCETETATTTGKLIEMGATGADAAAARAVGFEDIAMRSSRAAYKRTDLGSFRGQSGSVQSISAPRQDSAGQRATKQASPAAAHSTRTWSRNGVGWTVVTLCGSALLGILFYFPEDRLTRSLSAPQVAIATHKPASGRVLSGASPQPEKLQRSEREERRLPAMIIAPQPPSPAVSSKQHETRDPKTVILPQTQVATVNSTPGERLQVAEGPKTGFLYPVAPSPNLTGKVNLKAVIGTDGTVTEVEVLSGKRALAAAAVQAVRHWRYRPHELNRHAVEAEANITISFVGDDAVSVSFPAAH